MDITKILNNLSNKRKIFVSEADFQFALAWEISKRHFHFVNSVGVLAPLRRRELPSIST